MSLPAKFLEPSAHPILRQFAEDVISLLYADCETGKLTGENTLAEKSGADLIEELAYLVDKYGLTPKSVHGEEPYEP